MPVSTKQFLIDLFLDYLNNFLSISKFAEYHKLDYMHTKQLLEIGQHLHEQEIKMVKPCN